MENPGLRTTEFWLTAVANIAGSIIAILAAKGLLNAEEGDLWVALVNSIAVAAVPLALAYINGKYIQSRAEIKTTVIKKERADCE